ncbi:unnamed protein product [Choristocarpus tenellus]
MAEDRDSVTAIQEFVDRLALSMFDALRLIPFAEDVKEVEGENRGDVGTTVVEPAMRSPVEVDGAWMAKVKTLADGVVSQAHELNGLIDALPGANLTEQQQMEELSRLDMEGRKKRAELAKVVEKAEKLQQDVNIELDRLSEHTLGHR